MTREVRFSSKSGGDKSNGLIWVVFIMMVIFAGGNAVAVRFSNSGLPPFWGATLRFSAAAIIFWFIMLVKRVPLPRGKAFWGIILYGVLSIGISYGCLYLGLTRMPASFAGAVLALVPLLTLFFAWIHRLESLRWRSVLGALVATTGILIGVVGGFGESLHIPSMLIMIGGVSCLAESSVIFKLIPRSDPLATNALALTVGALMLLVMSLVSGESWGLPASIDTWVAYLYLVFIGSVVVFYLYLFVLSRWTASQTSYSFLLMPISTFILAVLLAGEQITAIFLFGAVLVIAGVWVGAVHNSPKTAEVTCSEVPSKSIG